MSDLSEVTKSCNRCFAVPAFFGTFFQELSPRVPAVTDLFAGADEIVLKAFLRKAVTLILLDAAGSPHATESLARVRIRHGPGDLNLNPDWFPHWIESLMAAISKHDPEYTPTLGKKWRAILKVGVQKVVPIPDP